MLFWETLFLSIKNLLLYLVHRTIILRKLATLFR